jgi:hypothetical protein
MKMAARIFRPYRVARFCRVASKESMSTIEIPPDKVEAY